MDYSNGKQYYYWIENDEAYVADDNSGELIWHGMPENKPVWKLLNISSIEDCIVLLEPIITSTSNQRNSHNLIRLLPNGNPLWHAILPTHNSEDYYTNIDWVDNKLFANSWSCFRVHIDIATGNINSKVFTK